MSAARELFSAQGYAATGREEIVAAAGVSRGALQHHFGDKLALFGAVYEQVEQEIAEVIAVVIAGVALKAGDDPIAQLRAGAHSYLDAAMHPAVRRICTIDAPAVLPIEVRQEIADRYALALVRDVLRSAMERGLIHDAPVEPLSRVLMSGTVSAADYVATSTDKPAARRQAVATLDLILGGLTIYGWPAL